MILSDYKEILGALFLGLLVFLTMKYVEKIEKNKKESNKHTETEILNPVDRLIKKTKLAIKEKEEEIDNCKDYIKQNQLYKELSILEEQYQQLLAK